MGRKVTIKQIKNIVPLVYGVGAGQNLREDIKVPCQVLRMLLNGLCDGKREGLSRSAFVKRFRVLKNVYCAAGVDKTGLRP